MSRTVATSSASPLRRCSALPRAWSPGGPRARPARATRPSSPRWLLRRPRTLPRRPGPRRRPSRRPRQRPRLRRRRPRRPPQADEEAGQEADPPHADDAAQQRRLAHSGGSHNSGSGGSSRSNPPATSSGSGTNQRAVRAAAGTAQHTGRVSDQARVVRADRCTDDRRADSRALSALAAPPQAEQERGRHRDLRHLPDQLGAGGDEDRPGLGGAGHPPRAHLHAGAAGRRPGRGSAGPWSGSRRPRSTAPTTARASTSRSPFGWSGMIAR